ncbi:MAG TPA: type II toxin-antitoxin system YafQ family toxin [Candidatus Paceibacterota bacterium]
MLSVFRTKAYRKAIKKYSGSGNFNIEKVESVIKTIQKGEKLDKKYRNHDLTGKYRGIMECHIKPDLLLLYKIEKENLILILLNLGSHSDLFG